MRKPLGSLILLLLCSVSLIAQDTLHFTDYTTVVGDISLVGDKNITYKRWDNPDGPNYEVSKSKVRYIVYKNGVREDYHVANSGLIFNTDTAVRRHHISVEIADLVLYNIGMSYELFSKSGKVGYRIPLSIGIDPYGSQRSFTNRRRRVAGGGFDVNFYVVDKRFVRLYVGPGVYYSLNLDDSANPYDSANRNTETSRVALTFNPGLMLQPSNHITLVGAASVGMVARFTNAGSDIGPAVGMRLAIGFRFGGRQSK